MEKPLVTDLRKPFYQLIDGFWILAGAETVQNDPKLQSKIAIMRKAMEDIERYITDNYMWD